MHKTYKFSLDFDGLIGILLDQYIGPPIKTKHAQFVDTFAKIYVHILIRLNYLGMH